jgi:hypothetical protein
MHYSSMLEVDSSGRYDHPRSRIKMKFSISKNYCISNIFVILSDRISAESTSWMCGFNCDTIYKCILVFLVSKCLYVNVHMNMNVRTNVPENVSIFMHSNVINIIICTYVHV